jgi:hypothetical protein
MYVCVGMLYVTPYRLVDSRSLRVVVVCIQHCHNTTV